MKAMQTLLAVGLLGALPAAALGQQSKDQPTNSVLSASTSTTATVVTTNNKTQEPVRPKPASAYSTTQYKLMEPGLDANKQKDKITRLGNMSSQAWTTIVSQQPNLTMVHNLSTHEPKFALCSFGHKPW